MALAPAKVAKNMIRDRNFFMDFFRWRGLASGGTAKRVGEAFIDTPWKVEFEQP